MSRRQIQPLAETAPRGPIDRLLLARICCGIGLLALCVAALAYLLEHDLSVLVLVSTIVGIVGISLWTTLAPNDLRTLITGRQALYGSNSIFASVLVIGIVVIGYALASNFPIAADLTEQHYYELKNNADKIVKSLDQPIQITAFYRRTRLTDQDIDAPILNMFRDASASKVKVVVLDPDENLPLSKTLGLVGDFGVFVSYLDDKGQPDPARTEQMLGANATEQWIAQAISKLEAKGKYKVLFTVGHGELGTDILKKEDAYGIRNGLENVGIATDTLDLKNVAIPANTTAIVMLAPQLDLGQGEVDKFHAYLDSGGKLLIMAKPAFQGEIQFMNSPDSPMAKYLWTSWGIRPQNDIVYDPSSYMGDPYRLLAASVNPHPIMSRDASGASQIRPFVSIAESWEINPTPPAGVTIAPLFASSPQSIGKVNLRKVAANPNDPSNLKLEQGDLQGPLWMAAALEDTGKNSRMIVIGDSDWVYNDAITQFDGGLLWTNMIDWLTRYLANVEVQPVTKQIPLIVDQASLNVVIVISLVILPGLVLLAGGLVWWDRSRRQ
jgi:ABC-type uncharacterized transport system involved in gliding motility auxiliary subunit